MGCDAADTSEATISRKRKSEAQDTEDLLMRYILDLARMCSPSVLCNCFAVSLAQAVFEIEVCLFRQF